MRKLARVLVSTLLVAGTSVPRVVLAADGTGTVVGTVMDGNHHAVSSMIVKATDVVDPSKIYTATSDGDGHFVIDSMPTGSYLVSADTVNTSWIQKDDSPIVEVSGSARPNVNLILVKTSELMPNAIGDSGGHNGMHVATIGIAALAAAAGITAVVNTNNLQDDNDKLSAENAELARQLQLTKDQLTEQERQLQEQLAKHEQDDSAERAQLQRQLQDVQRQLNSVNQQLRQLTDVINRLRLSSPFH